MSAPQFYPPQPPPSQRNRVPAWLIAVLASFGGVFMLCCGCPCMMSALMPNKVTSADKQWNAGQKEEAVSLYTEEIEGSLPSSAPHIYERVIEHHLERGNAARAAHFCELAAQREIELSPASEQARELFVQAKAKKQKDEQAAKLAQSRASTPQRRIVSRVEFGDKWPLTVEQGEVECMGGRIAVFHEAGRTWALNGTAQTHGYPEIEPIWEFDPDIPGARKNISPLIRAALELCE